MEDQKPPEKLIAPSFAVKADNFFSFGFFVMLFEAIQLDLLIPAFINITSMKLATFLSSFNMIISLGVLAISVTFCYNITTASIQLEKIGSDQALDQDARDKQIQGKGLGKWRFLKTELKENRTLLVGIVPELMILKDGLVAFLIVVFVQYPLV